MEQALALLLVIGRCTVRISSGIANTLIEIYLGFSQYLQKLPR